MNLQLIDFTTLRKNDSRSNFEVSLNVQLEFLQTDILTFFNIVNFGFFLKWKCVTFENNSTTFICNNLSLIGF